MTKPVAFAVAGGLAATALAALVTSGTHGRGRAESRDGRLGAFQFEVARRSEGDAAPVYSGRFRFEQIANRRGPAVLIESGKPAALVVTRAGNVCEFSAPAVLVRQVEGQRVTVPGRIDVRTEDRRSRERPRNEPDKIRVRFRAERGLTFEFDGLVFDGDLVVFRR